MINPSYFYNLLKEEGMEYFTGVPDSLLKSFCAYLMDNVSKEKHIITSNEGNAVARAAGYYLATGKTGVVYMQNSGLGNCVNPLMSLTDPEVYGIPLLLVIGWRGEPGVKDEPQHVKKGRITLNLLETMEIPFEVLDDNSEKLKEGIGRAVKHMSENNAPYALVVRKGLFDEYKYSGGLSKNLSLKRENAVELIVSKLFDDDIIVSTTGKTSRELFELREKLGQDHSKDFLTVGSMGHSSSIALAIASEKPSRKVYCLDGDGAFIMHMGSLTISGKEKPKNFRHIVLNNGSHESVGGQPTAAFDIDIPSIALACGYKEAFKVETSDELSACLDKIKDVDHPVLIEIMIEKGSRPDLGRPTTTTVENKERFMEFLK